MAGGDGLAPRGVAGGGGALGADAASDAASDAAPGREGRRWRNMVFTAAVAREVCRRMAAGETQREISADPAMPCTSTIWRWTRKHARFARAYGRARAIGAGVDRGYARDGFSQAAANEIVARTSEGEMLTMICADPHLPSLRTVVRWREGVPEFAEAMRQAREGLAERLADLGWRMALEATPETAYLTRVRLGQLRWTAAVMGPHIYGKMKPMAPVEPPEVTRFLFKHWRIEVHPETGQQRVVTYLPDPETNRPVRVAEGEWTYPIDPVAKAAEVERLYLERRAALKRMLDDEDGDDGRGGGGRGGGGRGPAGAFAPAAMKPHDPEGWC